MFEIFLMVRPYMYIVQCILKGVGAGNGNGITLLADLQTIQFR